MTPGLVDRGGDTHVHVMKGLELSKRQSVNAFVGIALLFVLPDLAKLSSYLSFGTVHKGLLFGFAAVGLNLLLRHTELVSFGHAAFFGGGAYTAAVLAAHLQVDSVLLLLFGAVVGATTLAVIIGYLVSGHLDIYFALLTLAFNQVLYAIVLGTAFFNYNDGLSVRGGGTRPELLGLSTSIEGYRVLIYYLTLVLVLVGLLIMWRIIKSPFGRALDAIGQNRTRARFIGIPVERYVWGAFVISGLYGGVAGGLFALVELHVRPAPVLFAFVSGEILFMAILGGFQTLLGPLLGGVVLVYMLDLGRHYTELFNLYTGLVLLVVVFLMPRGLLGSWPDIRAGLGRIREDPSVVGEMARAAGERLRDAVYRSVENLKLLLGGAR
jgi:branched-chain amino acid transport system permease protein